jgi:glucose-1-phosphate adenylyltransferase
MGKVLTLVLGGGRGTRLYPLTHYRSKPAVPLAGKYRLIDIPLSNCINSGLNRIYVLTQFNSVSLHRHIRRTYAFDAFSAGFVEILAAQQTLDAENWYQGTADAVRQNLRYIDQAEYDYVLVLSGDQLYRMDFRRMLDSHRETNADVTIAGIPVDRQTARSMGLMRVDDDGRVAGFLEKPQTDKEIDLVRMEPVWIDARGIESRGRDCLASMGIYLFNRDTLVKLLSMTDYRDFGREIFPAATRSHRVQVHLFDGYWEDIGTIRSFYEANLQLAALDRPFDLASAVAPIYTRARFLAPSRLDGVTVRNSLIADGCEIEEGTTIENSVIGLRCRIGRNVTIRDSVLMGSDDYESDAEAAQAQAAGIPRQGIGAGTTIRGAIIDKNCRIGSGVQIVNARQLMTTENTPDETDQAVIRDGIVCVQRGAVLPDGWTL